MTSYSAHAHTPLLHVHHFRCRIQIYKSQSYVSINIACLLSTFRTNLLLPSSGCKSSILNVTCLVLQIIQTIFRSAQIPTYIPTLIQLFSFYGNDHQYRVRIWKETAVAMLKSYQNSLRMIIIFLSGLSATCPRCEQGSSWTQRYGVNTVLGDTLRHWNNILRQLKLL